MIWKYWKMKSQKTKKISKQTGKETCLFYAIMEIENIEGNLIA